VIDPHLKWQLRRKLKQMHQELKHTLIYVTQDQVEALTFAQEVVVMTRGRAVQVGSAEALFERPAHTFVGHFIGSPGMNVFPVAVEGSKARVGGMEIELGYRPAIGDAKKVELGVRPECMQISREGMPLSIRKVEDIGRLKIVRADFAGQPVSIVVKEEAEIPAEPRLLFRDKGVHIYADSWRVGREA